MCAAPPVLDWPPVLDKLDANGWDVWAVPTPTAALWLDTDALASQTSHPVKSVQRLPTQADEMPPADAVLVAPATFNTVNKWAAGISDTFALGLLNELLGLGVPLTVATYCKPALASHPAYKANTGLLRTAGVNILEGDDSIIPSDKKFNWDKVLSALKDLEGC
jgi:hypothetical protein